MTPDADIPHDRWQCVALILRRASVMHVICVRACFTLQGYLLDRGFQVLQTAYPEARRLLDYQRLDLRHFAPGAMIRIRGRFYTLADPLRRPGAFLNTR